MSNTLLTNSKVTNEALRVLENNLTFAKGINRQYDKEYGIKGAKIGTTLSIRKPPRFLGRTGAAMSLEDQTDASVPLTLSTQFGVDLSWNSVEWSLSLDEFSDRILQPAMAVIANKIDRDGLVALYRATANSVGTPGTVPTALKTYLQAGAKMDYEATPRDKMRSLVLDPTAQVEIVDSLKGLMQSSTEVADQYKTGNMGLGAGFKWSMDQNIPVHQVGPLGGTPLVNGVPASGATSLVTDGWTAAAAARLKKGDTFTIANVYAVNPQSRVSTGQLRQFVVTADVSSDGSGNLTAAISPAIVSSGAFQNVDSLPADNAAITIVGAANTLSPVHMAYHRDAIVLGCADLAMPKGMHEAARARDEQLGIAIRMIQGYDITNDLFKCRFDVLYGYSVVYPELACRIHG